MNEEEYKDILKKMYSDIQKRQGSYGITPDDMRDVGVRSGLFEIKKDTMENAYGSKPNAEAVFKNTQDKYRKLMDEKKIRDSYFKKEYMKNLFKLGKFAGGPLALLGIKEYLTGDSLNPYDARNELFRMSEANRGPLSVR